MSFKQEHPEICKMPLVNGGNLAHAEDTIRQATEKTNFLVLPSLFREFEAQEGNEKSAMEGILPTLKKLDYVDHIVIGLDAADEKQYLRVLEIIKAQGLPQNVHIVWNNAPDIEKWREALASEEHEGRALAPSKPGKGRNVWGCVGYTNALMQQEGIDPSMANIAMHDCDITTYDPLMPARLFQPLCQKDKNGKYSPIEFVKANFKRYTDPDPTNENEQQEKGKLNARVTRLFGTSFIDTIQNVLQDLEGYNKELRGLLTYMRSFQYMFSGEMAFTGNVLNAIELPNDYSLEIRILEQVRKILPTKLGDAPRIADVEVAERYDHHHQDIGGLQKMVTQIASATFGIVNKKFTLTPEIINTIKNDYSLRAKGYAKHFNMVAANSELKTDLETEINTVRQFADMIPKAFEELQDGQVEKPSHSWNTIMEQEPNAPAKLLSIVNGLGGQIMSSNQIKSVVQIPAAEQNDNSPLAAPPYLRERANG